MQILPNYHQSAGSFDVQVVHQLGQSWQNVFDGADILMKHAFRYSVELVLVYFLIRTLYGIISSWWMKFVIRGTNRRASDNWEGRSLR